MHLSRLRVDVLFLVVRVFNVRGISTSQYIGIVDLVVLFRDDDTPFVRNVAVHDVANPALDLAGDLSSLALGAHRDVDVLATVVDLRHRTDEVLGMLALLL